MRSKLLVSFSGGRTSAFMSYVAKQAADLIYDGVAYVFANTGQEHERTLAFVNECDRRFGLGVVWVEADVNPRKGQPTTFTVTNYESASRNGEPFEAVIRKYGVANKSYPHCTRELKLSPIHAYVRSLGWTDYDTAIGIRTDEKRRVAKSSPYSIVYPLIDWLPTDKQAVNDWWAGQDFSLDLPEHLGNCVWCWKKSFKKLAMVANDAPEVFAFPARMEREYGHIGKWDDRVFFRQNLNTEQLLEQAGMVPAEILARMPVRPDEDGGCSESCEIYDMEAQS